MSNQTQVVRELYAAFEQRDVGAVLRGFDGDIEVFQTEVLPWGGTYRGTMGAASFFQKLAAAVDATVTAEDFFEAGNTVIATARTRGRVRSNDVRFDLRSVHVWTIREGKAVGISSTWIPPRCWLRWSRRRPATERSSRTSLPPCEPRRGLRQAPGRAQATEAGHGCETPPLGSCAAMAGRGAAKKPR